MPKTAALSIAFPQDPETAASVESPRSPPVDSGIEDYYKLSQPTQSPASSPRASRSFFSSFTGGKQNRGKAIEQPSLKIPSAPSSGQSTPTATHPTYHMSSDSQVNLPDTSSISEGKISLARFLKVNLRLMSMPKYRQRARRYSTERHWFNRYRYYTKSLGNQSTWGATTFQARLSQHPQPVTLSTH